MQSVLMPRRCPLCPLQCRPRPCKLPPPLRRRQQQQQLDWSWAARQLAAAGRGPSRRLLPPAPEVYSFLLLKAFREELFQPTVPHLPSPAPPAGGAADSFACLHHSSARASSSYHNTALQPPGGRQAGHGRHRLKGRVLEHSSNGVECRLPPALAPLGTVAPGPRVSWCASKPLPLVLLSFAAASRRLDLKRGGGLRTRAILGKSGHRTLQAPSGSHAEHAMLQALYMRTAACQACARRCMRRPAPGPPLPSQHTVRAWRRPCSGPTSGAQPRSQLPAALKCIQLVCPANELPANEDVGHGVLALQGGTNTVRFWQRVAQNAVPAFVVDTGAGARPCCSTKEISLRSVLSQ